jgi:hypothetical protein
MQYLRDQFTVPVGSEKISQRRWDYAFLSRKQFLEKYGADAEEYRPEKEIK